MDNRVQKTQSHIRDSQRIKAVYSKSVDQLMTSNISEPTSQTTKAATTSGYLRDIIRRNEYVSSRSQIRIRKTDVRPVMTY